MTPAELRALAEATPWPVLAGYIDRDPTDAEARLVRLAPDLARLCAELHDRLAFIASLPILHGETAAKAMQQEARAALTKLAELEAMTPDELFALADAAMQSTDEAEIRHAVEWLEIHAVDLARLCAELGEALETICAQQPKTLAMIECNGFVFDSIGHEPGNWQHLAFSIYTDLCEVESWASVALAKLAELEAPK